MGVQEAPERRVYVSLRECAEIYDAIRHWRNIAHVEGVQIPEGIDLTEENLKTAGGLIDAATNLTKNNSFWSELYRAVKTRSGKKEMENLKRTVVEILNQEQKRRPR